MFLRLYYQYSPSRLSACPLTIHALLHVVDGMEAAGPVWTYWAFPTERFCGRLLPEIRSRRHPFSNIDNFVVASAKLSQIKIMYNLDQELSLRPKKAEVLRGSFSHPSCASMSSFLFQSNSFSYRHWILRPQICSPSTPASLVDNSASCREQNRNSFCDSFQSNCEHCPPVFEAGEHHTMGTSSAAGRRGFYVFIGTVHPD
jgi:hypothetical protein